MSPPPFSQDTILSAFKKPRMTAYLIISRCRPQVMLGRRIWKISSNHSAVRVFTSRKFLVNLGWNLKYAYALGFHGLLAAVSVLHRDERIGLISDLRRLCHNLGVQAPLPSEALRERNIILQEQLLCYSLFKLSVPNLLWNNLMKARGSENRHYMILLWRGKRSTTNMRLAQKNDQETASS